MKHLAQILLLLLFLGSTQAFAQTKEKSVVVGTFALEKNAKRSLKRLKETFAIQPEIVELKKDANFEYKIRRSGIYYLVVIEPIIEYSVLNIVLTTARDTFADSFVNIMSKDIEVEITDDGYSADEAEDLESQKQEEILLAQEEASASEEATEIEYDASVEEDEADDESEDSDEDEAVESDEDKDDTAVTSENDEVSYIKDDNENKASILDDENLYMYVGFALLLFLVIIIVIKRKKSSQKSSKISDDSDLSNIILDDTKKEEVVAIDRNEETEQSSETSGVSEENRNESSEEVVEVVEEPVEEVKPPKVISRKRRDAELNRGKIQKSDFNKFEGVRILVAEDNLINQKVIMGLLGDSGMELVIAEDGQIALDILAEDKNFQMVLMDAHMPNVDGFEPTRAIRKDPTLDHIAVVALSGDTSADDIRKMNEAGMEETLEKPLKMDSLYSIFYCYFDLDNEESTETVSEVENQLEVADQLDAKEAEVEEELYENSVVNHAIGLEIAGDEELYLEIMDDFAKSYHESDTQIFEYLQDGNSEAALALLLDIQGIAGSIGASDLFETSTLYRVAITNNDELKMDEMQNRYSKDFLAVLNQIEAHKA